VARELQRKAGEHGEIWLPQPLLGKLLDRPPRTVGRIIETMIEEALLEPVDDSYSFTERKAKTYRFIE
jgi:hypothetical protein